MKKFIVFVLIVSYMPIFCMKGDDSLDWVGALKPVLEKALVHDRHQRRLREFVRALDRKEAHLCVLATDCEDESYRSLVRAITNAHSMILFEEQHCKYVDVSIFDLSRAAITFRVEKKREYFTKEDNNVASEWFLSFMDFLKKK